MRHPHLNVAAILTVFCTVGLGLTGCSKSDTSGGASAGANAGTSGSAGTDAVASDPSAIPGTGDPDAVKAVQTELKKRWLKTPDGWISEYHVKYNAGTVVEQDYDEFIEFKDLSFEVGGDHRTDTDKQNGIAFGASWDLLNPTMRRFQPFATDSSGETPTWSAWRSQRDLPSDIAQATYVIFKQNGTWQVGGEVSLGVYGYTPPMTMWSGTKPDPSAVANLPDAVNAVQTELQKHWLKTPDGWISQYHERIAGTDINHDVFLEFKQLDFQLGQDDNSDAAKQIGVQFHASWTLSNPQMRRFERDVAKGGGQWTSWQTEPAAQKPYIVSKDNGVWAVGGNENLYFCDLMPDMTLWAGAKPDASTIANLK